MPPKPSAKRTKSTLEKDEEAQYALTGVVLCDTGSDNFRPLSKEIHPILFPLAGTPILAYTLEFLERGGLEDILLICSSHYDQIQKYIAFSRWGEKGYPVKVRVVVAAAIRSTGDAMREIDRLGLVKSDFVVIRGGILSNLPLLSIVEEHRRRREEDKGGMLMTLVTLATETHTAFSSRRNLREARMYVLDDLKSETTDYTFHRTLLSERLDPYPDRKRLVYLSKEIISKHTNFLLRNDLCDCNIEICTPEVPALFTENFDYEDLRSDFVNGVLTSDLISKNIYCYIAKSGYSSKFTDFEEYWNANNDMLGGLTAPFDPMMNLENDQTYTKKGSMWREKDVKIDKAARVSQSVIGAGTTIGERAKISNSVIGRNCVIPPGVTIKDSIVWNKVTLLTGVTIKKSIIAENTIPTNLEINEKNVLLPNTAASLNNLPTQQSWTIYGHTPTEEDDFDSESETDLIPVEDLNLSDTSISDIGSDSDSESESIHRRRRRSSATSGTSDHETTHEEFYTEAEESLLRAFQENHSVENATIELKTLRMATNVTFHEVREAIVAALLDLLVNTPGRAKAMFAKWGELLDKFTEDEEAQKDVLFITQRWFLTKCRECVDRQRFVQALQALYQADVLDEERILEWYEDDRAKGIGEKWSEDMAALRKAADGFIIWLKEAEEESDESDE